MHKSRCKNISNTRCSSIAWTSVPGVVTFTSTQWIPKDWLSAWPGQSSSISQVVSPEFCPAVQLSRAVLSHCTPHLVKMGPRKANMWWCQPCPPLEHRRHGNKLPSGPDPVACAWELEPSTSHLLSHPPKIIEKQMKEKAGFDLMGADSSKKITNGGYRHAVEGCVYVHLGQTRVYSWLTISSHQQ